MFTPEQKLTLAGPLNREHVKSRKQAGRTLSYVEGWVAIAEANRVFGFDAWSSETVDIRVVAEGPRKIGGGTDRDGNPRPQKDGWGVSYVARVRVVVGGVTREGVGAGHGIDVDLGLAHESAIKEAETDARKRALMTFGNIFGLALYDKEQRNVADVPPEPEPPDPMQAEYVRSCWERINGPMTEAELREWWRSQAPARRSFDLTQEVVDKMKAAVAKRLAPPPADNFVDTFVAGNA